MLKLASNFLTSFGRGSDDDFVERVVARARGGSLFVGCVGAPGTAKDTGDGGGDRIQNRASWYRAAREFSACVCVSCARAPCFVILL